jgi:hypothetical protein
MTRFFKDKESYQHIQAAPLDTGGCSLHTHRTIHWGNAPLQEDQSAMPLSKRTEPRISLSFSFSDPAFEPPYFDPKVRGVVCHTPPPARPRPRLRPRPRRCWAALCGSRG